ncbi:pyridoxamine 5'-phosphate oxidase family protein [Balneolales bacterium ANBcel1]|nr:pyridoxamine 5'-phosphate oxidase family protein [Balneolales bacterium ANBcel1]
MKRFSSLEEIREDIWRSLLEARDYRKGHPFRFPVLATVSGGKPLQRMVVLRKVFVSSRIILFHTDRRSRKVLDMERCPDTSWLVYDSKNRIQLQMEGKAEIHAPDSELHADEWKHTTAAERRIYSVKYPPGTIVSDPDDVWPEAVRDSSTGMEEVNLGEPNFRVVTVEINRMDWLQLHPEGEFRAGFKWEDNTWKSYWRCP